jgi:hypothetical protein
MPCPDPPPRATWPELADDCPAPGENGGHDRDLALLTLQERIALSGGGVEVQDPDAWVTLP